MSQQIGPDHDPAPNERIYHRLEVAAALLLAIGTITYRYLEDWSWIDSLYFSTVALTTVGFGDLTPTHDLSKLFTVVYLLTGVTILVSYLNARLARRRWRQ
ncbi:potassium channel family protein [Demequina sp. NBRC 110054]|uniref:potassium channel family protein n=1 Tax=Demequina sp. NBRC 110054 TaxID=1570343 RepID=UPI000A06CE81|nr:potassium channel family protein [Demequina sp. NBRC 110054]